MKKLLFLCIFVYCVNSLWGQQDTIPSGAEFVESTEYKNNGIPYIIESRYRLQTGEILYAYYNVANNVSTHETEQIPIFTVRGNEISISGMPGYREFNFGDDRRRLVQFMKLLRLGQPISSSGANRTRARTPSLSDSIFNLSPSFDNEFRLLLDLYDETWVLEHTTHGTRTTTIIRVNEYSD